PGAVGAQSLVGRVVGVASPNPIVREGARRQVEACGGRAVLGHDVAETLSRLDPDVVLIDASLAAANGALKPPPGRPAIVLLAPDERDRITRFRRAGFSGYLIKPLRRASLAERVLIAAGAAAAAAAPPREDERIATAAAPGARVLLVEDNPINALLARALLSREGCEVEHAVGGEEALAATEVKKFDLILMDMRMPGLSGEETARRMRASGIVSPIVALTANAFEDDRHACLAAGMDDFLVKPLSPDALRAALTRWTGPNFTKPAARAKVG
ncbi:MAG TPA: response regulator, partial [Caulobacteraceae bacterium]|nr:response regulator [Caulobacteraceae bacterium]